MQVIDRDIKMYDTETNFKIGNVLNVVNETIGKQGKRKRRR